MLWVDLSTLHTSLVQIHGILSNTHRQAAVRWHNTRITVRFHIKPCLWYFVPFSTEGSAFFWFPLLWTPRETNYHSDGRWVSLLRYSIIATLFQSGDRTCTQGRLCPTPGEISKQNLVNCKCLHFFFFDDINCLKICRACPTFLTYRQNHESFERDLLRWTFLP